MLPRPGPMNDWPVAMSYSQPCHGQASSGGPESIRTSPGPPETARGASVPDAQRAELVRAPVAERVELVVDAEDPDGLAVHVDDLPVAVLEVGDLANDDLHALPAHVARRAGPTVRLSVNAR